MIIKIIIVLSVGIYLGDSLGIEFADKINPLSDILLYMILFVAGLSIGYSGGIKTHIKGIGKDVIMVPLFTIIGTLIGSYLSSFLLDLSLYDCLAVGSGLGWYSLSAVMITEYDAQLGAISFMANIFRELFALMFIPIVAKNIGFIEAVSMGAATSGDTTLPPLSKSTDTRTIIIAVFSGMIISFSVPFLVEFFIALR